MLAGYSSFKLGMMEKVLFLDGFLKKWVNKSNIYFTLFVGLIIHWLLVGLIIHWLHPLHRSKISTPQKKKGCPGYDMKLHLMVKFQFCRFRKSGIPLYYHYFQVHSVPEWYLLLRPHQGIRYMLDRHTCYLITMCKKKKIHKKCRYKHSEHDSLTSTHKITLDVLTCL